jgi:hypothetical protein
MTCGVQLKREVDSLWLAWIPAPRVCEVHYSGRKKKREEEKGKKRRRRRRRVLAV